MAMAANVSKFRRRTKGLKQTSQQRENSQDRWTCLSGPAALSGFWLIVDEAQECVSDCTKIFKSKSTFSGGCEFVSVTENVLSKMYTYDHIGDIVFVLIDDRV